MASSAFRTLAWLLVAVVSACSSPLATPLPTLQPTDLPAPIPTVSPTQPRGTEPPATESPPPAPTLPEGPLADAIAADLDRTLAEQLDGLRIPGMNAAIVFPDGSRWTGAVGFADVDRDLET